jgi:uncharacterized pyridoxamine 5'-phosphate oxidase family protein
MNTLRTALLSLTLALATLASAQTPATMTQVHDFLKKTQTYFLATLDGDQPRVRPFGTINLFEGKLYIQTGRRKDVARQLLAHPKAELCAYDATSGTWLRIAATFVEDPRREAKAAMLTAYPSLQAMYSPDDDNTLVLYLKDATATFSSFTGEPQVVKF